MPDPKQLTPLRVKHEIADRNLRDYAYDLILAGLEAKSSVPHKNLGIWSQMGADLFVTAYHEAGDPSSANVWCCYSNGDPEGLNTVPENILGAVDSCLTRDTRHAPILSGISNVSPPAEVDLTILAPKNRWILIKDLKDISRDKKRALYVKTSYGSAFYIPSVWTERPDWIALDIIKSLAKKAHGSLDSILSIYEVPVYEIPSPSLEGEKEDERNRGFFPTLEHNRELQEGGLMPQDESLTKVLEKAWHFYYDNRSDDYRLAYQISDGIPIYDNQGAYVRTYSDLITFDRLSEFLGKKLKIAPYANALLDDPSWIRGSSNDSQVIASRIELLRHFLKEGKNKSKSLKELVGSFELLAPGVYDNDLSFANPQIIMTIATLIPTIIPFQKGYTMLTDYLDTIDHQIDIALQKHGAFAANWISQALFKIYEVLQYNKGNKYHEYLSKIQYLASSDGPIQPILRNAALHAPSVTERACAITGLEALYRIKEDHELLELIEKALYDIVGYQLDNAGFPYDLDNSNLVRTDVTSHVVEAILGYLSL